MANVNFDLYCARAYCNKIKSSQDRGIEFDLSFEFFKSLMMTQTCHYTGIQMTTPPYTTRGGVPGDYQRRGTDRTIERIDHKVGYVPSNTVAVCAKANNLKSWWEAEPHRWECFNLDKFKEMAKAKVIA